MHHTFTLIHFSENTNSHFDTLVPPPVPCSQLRIASRLVPSSGNFGTSPGTEELAHMEIVAAIVHQLTRNLTVEQIEESGFGPYYIDHTTGIWPQSAGGVPFTATAFQSKGDAITDLHEDMAADGTTA